MGRPLVEQKIRQVVFAVVVIHAAFIIEMLPEKQLYRRDLILRRFRAFEYVFGDSADAWMYVGRKGE